jgi:hypothetical protein
MARFRRRSGQAADLSEVTRQGCFMVAGIRKPGIQGLGASRVAQTLGRGFGPLAAGNQVSGS